MSIRDCLPQQIATKRLVLRAPVDADLGDLVALLNNWSVVANTAVIPFPYGESDGREFLATLSDASKPRAYAIAETDGRLMGVVSLKCEAGQPPELGYWLGEPCWGRGYASEAATALVEAAQRVGVSDIRARVLASNPASVRVLEKAGFIVVERTLSVVERHLGQPLLILRWSAR